MLPENINATFDRLSGAGVDIGNYNDLWCVSETHFSQLLWQVQRMDLYAHAASHKSRSFDANAAAYSVVGGGSVAVVDIQGTMTKKGSSLAEGGSTIRARRAIRQAVADETVTSIVLRMDSPGGTVSGTADLADDVRKAGQKKRVIGFVEDLAASAGCWVISQCSEVYANANTAQIGSIGTYLGLYDLSAMAEKEGIKPVVIKAGEFKAGGFPGTEISDAQIEKWQTNIDAIQAEFTAAVAQGRNMPVAKVQELVTGLTYPASDAMSLGLIDGIRSFDDLIEELRPTQRRGVAMSEQVSYDDIVKACKGFNPKSTDDKAFIADCMASKMSAEESADLWSESLIQRAKDANAKADELAAENLELRSKVEQLEAELEDAKKVAPKSKGVAPVGTAPTQKASTDAQQAWKDAINAKVQSGMSRANAVKAVNRENPELREAVVASAN